MNASLGLERCFTFINCQLTPDDRSARARAGRERKLAITLSRQTGSGALMVAEKLAELMQAKAAPGSVPWTIFDRNLVEKALEEHNLPKTLARFMPEDRVSLIEDMLQELLGLHPPSWTLVRQTTETILKLAELGNVILVGRGATVITSKLPHVFHARLVGSLERRAERVKQRLGLSEKAAFEFIAKEDAGRQHYLRAHFRAAVDDPLLYHLTINTDRIGCEEAARLIAEAAGGA